MIWLCVYNMKGELVSTLSDTKMDKGNHKVSFSAKGFDSGIYFYDLSVNGRSAGVKRMLLIK